MAALSPLTGAMDKQTWQRVLDEEVIVHDGKKYAWTIPLAFPVDAATAGTLQVGKKVALVNAQGSGRLRWRSATSIRGTRPIMCKQRLRHGA